jgi:nucleotide-binding universal stress UspA family protein
MKALKSILIAADLLENNADICADAILFAKMMEAEVTLIHAIEYIPYYPYYPYNEEKFIDDCQAGIHARMDKLKDVFIAQGLKVNENIVEHGKAYEVICNAAEKIDACGIIIGVGNHFLLENIIGSTAEKVSRLATKPVTVINPSQKHDFKKITCAYDFSDNGMKALIKSVQLAKSLKAHLDIIHVVEEQHYYGLGSYSKTSDLNLVQEKLKNTTDTISDLKDLSYQNTVLTGKPEVEVAKFAKNNHTSLLLISAHGHNIVSRFFLGSTSANLLRLSPCTTMIVK